MIKFIIPAIIIFLVVLFWEKINEYFLKKLNIKINYIFSIIFFVILLIIIILLYFQYMKNINSENFKIVDSEGVFIIKNINTTIGFIRYNKTGEIEYIFVNPLFRKKGFAKKLLKLVKDKTRKKILLKKPISPLGAKLKKFLS